MQRIERLLGRYFSGAVETNGSNFGAMIDRMQLFSMVAFPCMAPGCQGGFTSEGKDCPRCRGTAFQGSVKKSAMPYRDFVHAQCRACKGGGKTLLSKAKERAMKFLGEAVPRCPDCGGTGSIVPIDALPGAPSKQEAGYTMREGEMEFQAVVNRVLRHVLVSSSLNYYALLAYYGPIGDHWETFNDLGRIFALWPLTRPGQALLDLKCDPSITTPYVQLQWHTQKQTSDPTDERGDLMRQAHTASGELHRAIRLAVTVADREHDGRLAELAMRPPRNERPEPTLQAVA